jgi:hypothetical protein
MSQTETLGEARAEMKVAEIFLIPGVPNLGRVSAPESALSAETMCSMTPCPDINPRVMACNDNSREHVAIGAFIVQSEGETLSVIQNRRFACPAL